jgi:hypothetical protein
MLSPVRIMEEPLLWEDAVNQLSWVSRLHPSIRNACGWAAHYLQVRRTNAFLLGLITGLSPFFSLSLILLIAHYLEKNPSHEKVELSFPSPSLSSSSVGTSVNPALSSPPERVQISPLRSPEPPRSSSSHSIPTSVPNRSFFSPPPYPLSIPKMVSDPYQNHTSTLPRSR